MLTVTYLFFVVRVQFCWEELSFKDFFGGGGKALVLSKVLVRNFGSFFHAAPKLSVFCQPATTDYEKCLPAANF